MPRLNPFEVPRSSLAERTRRAPRNGHLPSRGFRSDGSRCGEDPEGSRLRAEIRGSRQAGSKAQSYLGSPVPVLGVRIPRLRAIVSAFRRAHRDLAVGDLNRLASSLWAGPTFEEKALAISLLDAFGKSLDAESWRVLDAWAGESSGWGLCDSLALGPITKIVHSQPRRFREVVRWTKSENRWRRRIAVYAMRDFVFAGELDRPFDVFERLLYDDEVWVQRAVGTWLRESWKKDRERTAAFLSAHARGLPPVTITVATERAPKAFREKLRRDARAATRTARRDRRDLPS